MKKIFYISLGFISLGIGIAGIVLPVVPTTPLVLLSAFCFSRSSEKFD
ncbi:YbaN family protein, partial [Streptococcus sp. SPC0]|nr:YbaN family protein [Streptococcus sp. SPC0]